MKKNFATNNKVFIVGRNFDDNSIEPIAVFKTIKSARSFIDECRKLVDEIKTIEVGPATLDRSDIENLEILLPFCNNDRSYPYFDK